MKLFSWFKKSKRTDVAAKPLFERLEGRAMLSASPALTKPSSLTVTPATATTVKLTWNDNSNSESGYKIERSSDGTTFGLLNTVGKNVESYTTGAITPGKKYYFRVRAYSSAGYSSYSNVVNTTLLTTKTVPAPVLKPVPAPPVTTTQPPGGHVSTANGGVGAYATGKWYFDGVNIGFDNPDQVAKAIPILKDLHVGSVRLWFGMNTWQNRAGKWSLQEAKDLHDAGFKVLMNVGVATVPTYSEAAAFFKYLTTATNARSVDIWEIGNEPNQKAFWQGTASQYVNQELKAAWDMMHPAGFKIAGAGATWDVTYAQQLKDAGYLNYVDYANFHPYGPSPQEVAKRAAGAKAVFAGKPIIFTEWNVRGSENNPTQWAAEVDQARKLLAPIAEIAFYFPFTLGSTMAGKGGLVTTSYAPREPFYDIFKGWGE